MEELKKTLIYLYEYFNGSNSLIKKELLENKLKANKEIVNDFLIANEICINDYICFWEEDFPEEFKIYDNSTMIVKKVIN